jgi:uncharacterized protein YdaU (DUF1376 family)
MTDFYKMDPGAWDHGTANLSLEEEAAYLRVVNAMHKNKSPVPNNVRVWAGMFRCSTRKARALVAALIDAGKLALTEDGLVNERAISDLVHRGFVSVSRAESGAKGGRIRAENARKLLETNNPKQANASSREEKRREENPQSPQGGDDPFDLFWNLYPRKVGKEAARKAFDKAVKKAPVSDIMAGLHAQLPAILATEPRFQPHPATWLNQGRWQDEVQKPERKARNLTDAWINS